MTVFERMSQIRARMRELSTLLRTEQREMNEAERDEYNSLRRELDWLDMEMRASQAVSNPSPAENPLYTVYRSAVEGNNSRYDICARTAGDTGNAQVTAGGLVPTVTQEVLMPIHEALIWDKVGIRIPSGVMGAAEWPVVNSLEVTFAGETAEANGQQVDLSKVNLSQQRITAIAKVSRSAVINSNGVISEVVNTLMPDAAAVGINKVVMSPTKPDNSNIAGPFVNAAKKTLSAVFGDTTYKECNKIKASLLAKGYSSKYLCWVMTEDTKAELEATPIDAGSGIMCVVNDKFCGLPIYCTEHIGDNLGLGDWRYYALSQRGPVSYIVDPVTLAPQDTIRNIYNALYDAGTLRQDAFILIKKATPA